MQISEFLFFSSYLLILMWWVKYFTILLLAKFSVLLPSTTLLYSFALLCCLLKVIRTTTVTGPSLICIWPMHKIGLAVIFLIVYVKKFCFVLLSQFYFNCLMDWTHGQFVIVPASCSGCHRLKFQPCYPDWRVFIVFLSLCRQIVV